LAGRPLLACPLDRLRDALDLHAMSWPLRRTICTTIVWSARAMA
jgi:hypothetical protein